MNLFPQIAIVVMLSAALLGVEKDPWNSILATVNAPHSSSMPVTHSLEQDLMKVHAEELAALERRWIEKKTSQKDRAMVRAAKNRFFHEEIEKLNRQTYGALEKGGAASKGADYRSVAKKALERIAKNPMTRPENVHEIPNGDQIGFCFSRALLIHYWLLKGGVPQAAIAKIFNVGDLMVEGTMWKFHVGILLRDGKEGFIVVDPLQKDILPYKEWLKINSAYEIKRPLSRSRFYVTSPRKFLPSFAAYDRKQIEDPVLKNYFEALGPTLVLE